MLRLRAKIATTPACPVRLHTIQPPLAQVTKEGQQGKETEHTGESIATVNGGDGDNTGLPRALAHHAASRRQPSRDNKKEKRNTPDRALLRLTAEMATTPACPVRLHTTSQNPGRTTSLRTANRQRVCEEGERISNGEKGREGRSATPP
jgi:hypothetical protein